MWSFPTGLLKFADPPTVIGTTEVLTLSCPQVMGYDGWQFQVAYVDHEDNDDDFADKLSDMDNFYIGYNSITSNARTIKAHPGVLFFF